jgi:hypothetical protein
VGVAVLVGLVGMAAVARTLTDDRRTPVERARLVLRDAAARQRRGCPQQRRFTVYALGERFRKEYATRLAATCRSHANEAEVFYGPCRDGGESGCGHDISVRSRPACQRPSEISTTFNGPPAGDLPNPKTIATLRGVPAAVFEDQIVLLTRDTLIIVFADHQVAQRAVDALHPVPQATVHGALLPKPAARLVGGKLTKLRCIS